MRSIHNGAAATLMLAATLILTTASARAQGGARALTVTPPEPEITSADDPDGKILAAREAAKRTTGGPDYSTARQHSAMFPAAPLDPKAGVDEKPFKTGKGKVVRARDAASLTAAWRQVRTALDAATPVKLVLEPGTYRLEKRLELMGLSETARDTPFVIEAARPGTAVLSGSQTAGWEPAAWASVPGEPGLYVHDWPFGWKAKDPGVWGSPNPLTSRREMLVVNGRRMGQVLLREMSYRRQGVTADGAGAIGARWVYGATVAPATLKPGQFGIDDDAKKVYLRAPTGVAWDRAAVEVPVADQLLYVVGKNNFVLRGLSFRHTNGYDAGAVQFNEWMPDFDRRTSRNILIEDCDFSHNGGTGLDAYWMYDSEWRRCRGNDNGDKGLRPYFVEKMKFSDCQANRNTWRGGAGASAGWSPAGRAMYFVNCEGSDNYKRGLREDHLFHGVLFENCRFSGNREDGITLEIGIGPITFRDCEVSHNGQAGLELLAVDHLTIEGCRFIDNQKAAFHFEGGNRTYRDAFTPGQFARVYNSKGNEKVEPDLPGFTDYTFRNNVFATTRGPDSLLIMRFWDAGRGKSRGNVQKYAEWFKSEYKGENNRYWNTNAARVFDASQDFARRDLVDFETWKKATGSEQGSTWGPPPGKTR
jgi:hypothetical protein